LNVIQFDDAESSLYLSGYKVGTNIQYYIR